MSASSTRAESKVTPSVLALLQEAEEATNCRVWPGTMRRRAATVAERSGLLGYAGVGSYMITSLGRAALTSQASGEGE